MNTTPINLPPENSAECIANELKGRREGYLRTEAEIKRLQESLKAQLAGILDCEQRFLDQKAKELDSGICIYHLWTR